MVEGDLNHSWLLRCKARCGHHLLLQEGADGSDDPAHLRQHLKEPKHAIWAWFNGQSIWSDEYERFECQAQGTGLYWAWLDYEQAVVLVISCFDLEGA